MLQCDCLDRPQSAAACSRLAVSTRSDCPSLTRYSSRLRPCCSNATSHRGGFPLADHSGPSGHPELNRDDAPPALPRAAMLRLLVDQCVRQRRRAGFIDALPCVAKELSSRHGWRWGDGYGLCGRRHDRRQDRHQTKRQCSSCDESSHGQPSSSAASRAPHTSICRTRSGEMPYCSEGASSVVGLSWRQRSIRM
jgi:hypothetical protein